jgi:hypothetical protein
MAELGNLMGRRISKVNDYPSYANFEMFLESPKMPNSEEGVLGSHCSH